MPLWKPRLPVCDEDDLSIQECLSLEQLLIILLPAMLATVGHLLGAQTIVLG